MRGTARAAYAPIAAAATGENGWCWVEKRSNHFHSPQPISNNVMEHQQDTEPSAGKPGDDVQPPERSTAVEFDQGAAGAPAMEVVLVAQRMVRRSEDDMIGNVKARRVNPSRRTLPQARGLLGTLTVGDAVGLSARPRRASSARTIPISNVLPSPTASASRIRGRRLSGSAQRSRMNRQASTCVG
jgi:hypothetical protein